MHPLFGLKHGPQRRGSLAQPAPATYQRSQMGLQFDSMKRSAPQCSFVGADRFSADHKQYISAEHLKHTPHPDGPGPGHYAMGTAFHDAGSPKGVSAGTRGLERAASSSHLTGIDCHHVPNMCPCGRRRVGLRDDPC
jgi:hypothetical protein